MQDDINLSVLNEILKQGTVIRTQTQLLLVTQPLLARVCTVVEAVLPSVDLYQELEPREQMETGNRGSKPKYGNSLMLHEPRSTKWDTRDDL